MIRRALGLLSIVFATSALAADVLERGNGPEPSTLDAHRCPEIACANILRDLYEGLVAEAADGSLIPGAAQSWTVSPDGRDWRFILRDDLRWSNGERLDAQQFQASLRRALAPETAALLAAVLKPIVNAEAVLRGELPIDALGISAPDATTLEIRLTHPAPLPRLLALPIAFPLYFPALQRHGAQHTRAGNLVGNGAYRLHTWSPQSHLELVRNPHFHASADVALARVRYHVTEDASSELKRFQAGDLHITETLPPRRLDELRTRYAAELRVAPYLGSFYLGFNLTRAPFRANRELREALCLALDRDVLTRYVTALGEAPAYTLVPPGIAGYAAPRPEWASLSESQRIALAQDKYRAAGYSAERPLSVELRYNTSLPHRKLMLAVAAMWRETLGVKTVLRNEEWKVFVQNRRQRAITQVFRAGWIADYDDALSFLEGFAGNTPLNTTGFVDAKFDALLDQARITADPALRNDLFAAAERRLLDEQAILPLYFYTSKHLVRPEVRGYLANPLDRHASRWLSLQP